MKTLIKIFILLFLSSYSFAQLSVRNNAYVFATDIEVFVEDDVNLEENTTRFYLRDEAQLLQGTGTTGNSGLGKLSVYQEGTVHNYAYNYWASPVGEVSANNNANRDFIVGDILNEATGLITSSPAVIGTSYDGFASPLTISKHWLYSYNPGTQYSEWDFLGNGAALLSGYGFSMKGSTGSTNQRYDFAGKPNNGNIDVAVLANQYTLVGNPYPSAINAGAFIHDPNNTSDMMGTLLFWEHDLTVASHNLTDYVGGYASYTVAADGSMETFIDAMFATLDSNGMPTGTSYDPLTSKQVRQYLPIGQGFMIEGATGTTGTVTFTNAHREYYQESNTASEFFKTNNTNTFNQNPPNNTTEFQYNADGFQILDQGQGLRRFRLNVDFNDEITRPLVHNFHPNATNGFDYGLECNNSEPNPRDAYFIDGDMPFVAQAHNYDIDLKIPLVVKLDENLPLRIRMYDVQNFNDEHIYLHDKITDLYYDLTVQDFNINLEAGTHANRFEITFNNGSTLSTEEFEDSNFTVFQNNTLSQLVIVNPESLAIKTITLIDVSGKNIFNKIDLKKTTRYEFSTKNLSDGVYVANIVLENNNTLSKKIIVANK